MKFPYFKVIDFPKHQKRERILPWIKFGIFNPQDKDKIIYPVGLVDSGSDVTIIDHEFAKELGVTIEKGNKVKIYGVGGGSIDVWFCKLGLLIHDGSKKKPIIYQDYVGFTFAKFPLTMPQQTAILGTTGFFRHLIVSFDYPRTMMIKAES